MKNGDKVKYRMGLTFTYIGENPTVERESFCIHPNGRVDSLQTEDLTLVATVEERMKLAEQFKQEALTKILNSQSEFLDGVKSATKKNKKQIKDRINAYKSQLKDLKTPKLSKRIDEEKIRELEIRIDTLNKLL